MTQRKYKFSWDLIGDLEEGRPNLGPTTNVAVYRLMQFTLRDVIERHVGTEKVDTVFYEAGKLAGYELFKQFFPEPMALNEFVKRLQHLLKELNMGIMRVEKTDLETGEFVISVAEDLDCSGLPELDYETCIYDEGLLAGLLESFSGEKYKAKEVDCWCTGSRTCRSSVTREEAG